MEDERVCPVCFDTYKFPKILPCKHTFCMLCLEEYLDGFEDRSNLLCPLCREPCFVPAERYPKQCQICHCRDLAKVCHHCNTVLCRTCDSLHFHEQRGRNEGDSENEATGNLSPFLRFQLMQQNIRTEVLCQPINIFLGQFTSADETHKSVTVMFRSREEGIFVKLSDSNSLLKYNVRGKILKRIPLACDLTSGLETSDGRLIVAHLNSERHIACYNKWGIPESFAVTPKFLPVGLTELRNGNIAVCGPTHLCDTSCRKGICDVSKGGYGLMSIFDPRGKLVREIIKDQGEYIFKLPVQMAANTKTDTIAICDRVRERIIILDYNGSVRGFFKGLENMPLSFLPIPIQMLGSDDDHFHPASVCATSDGNFLVADPNKECLLVINPYGKLIGILRSDSGTDLSGTSSVCIDNYQNIWAGHINMGTISVLKPNLFQNQFQRMERLRRPTINRNFLNGPNPLMSIQIGSMSGSMSDLHFCH